MRGLGGQGEQLEGPCGCPGPDQEARGRGLLLRNSIWTQMRASEGRQDRSSALYLSTLRVLVTPCDSIQELDTTLGKPLPQEGFLQVPAAQQCSLEPN